MPYLQKHQIREGENLSKIHFVEDDDTIPNAAINSEPGTEPSYLSSVEQEKFLLESKNVQV